MGAVWCNDETIAVLKRAAIDAELRAYNRALADKIDAERRMRVAARELAALGETIPENP